MHAVDSVHCGYLDSFGGVQIIWQCLEALG